MRPRHTHTHIQDTSEWRAITELAASRNCIHSSCWKSSVFIFPHLYVHWKCDDKVDGLGKYFSTRALCSSIYWPFMFDFRKLLIIIICAWWLRRWCRSHSLQSALCTQYTLGPAFQFMEIFSIGQHKILVHPACGLWIRNLITILFSTDGQRWRVRNFCGRHGVDEESLLIKHLIGMMMVLLSAWCVCRL